MKNKIKTIVKAIKINSNIFVESFNVAPNE